MKRNLASEELQLEVGFVSSCPSYQPLRKITLSWAEILSRLVFLSIIVYIDPWIGIVLFCTIQVSIIIISLSFETNKVYILDFLFFCFFFVDTIRVYTPYKNLPT